MSEKNEDQAEIGAGDVPVSLLEKGVRKDFKLKCSLEAALTLSKSYGGLVGAMNRCLNYDVDTIVTVFAAGLGKNSPALAKAIYDEGYANASIPAVRFITNLTYGGRPPPKKAKKDGGDPLGEAVEDEGTIS